MKTLKEVEREYIIEVLNVSESYDTAVKILGISIRGLRNKINEYKIDKKLGRKKRAILDDDFNCMRKLTPKERDFFENIDWPKRNRRK